MRVNSWHLQAPGVSLFQGLGVFQMDRGHMYRHVEQGYPKGPGPQYVYLRYVDVYLRGLCLFVLRGCMTHVSGLHSKVQCAHLEIDWSMQ
jgi:hypothetical protein